MGRRIEGVVVAFWINKYELTAVIDGVIVTLERVIGDKDTDEKAAKKFNIKYLNVDNKTDLYNIVKKYLIK